MASRRIRPIATVSRSTQRSLKCELSRSLSAGRQSRGRDRAVRPAHLRDCLTLWPCNACSPAATSVRGNCETLSPPSGPAGSLVPLANEVGLGIVPDNALARAFRDHAVRLTMPSLPSPTVSSSLRQSFRFFPHTQALEPCERSLRPSSPAFLGARQTAGAYSQLIGRWADWAALAFAITNEFVEPRHRPRVLLGFFFAVESKAAAPEDVVELAMVSSVCTVAAISSYLCRAALSVPHAAGSYHHVLNLRPFALPRRCGPGFTWPEVKSRSRSRRGLRRRCAGRPSARAVSALMTRVPWRCASRRRISSLYHYNPFGGGLLRQARLRRTIVILTRAI